MSIEITGVAKRYGSVTALQSIDLSFEQGKIYGLLGRNGAGKTTLLNIITNRIFADSGQVFIDGQSVAKDERAMNKLYMIGEQQLYPRNMKVADVLRWSKMFYPGFDSEFARGLARDFGLDTSKKVRALSTGYSTILKDIVALAVDCPYVLLDEPVLGLDANHRDLFYRTLVARYAEKPATYIISTHLIEEVARVIEDVVIIKQGAIITNEPCEDLVASGYTVSGRAESVDRFVADKQVIGSDNLGGLKSVYILGQREESVPEDLEITRLDLQKLFIQLTA